MQNIYDSLHICKYETILGKFLDLTCWTDLIIPCTILSSYSHFLLSLFFLKEISPKIAWLRNVYRFAIEQYITIPAKLPKDDRNKKPN